MAGFLVLEEDGTSHLELEENTDDLLLEAITELSGFGKVGTVGRGPVSGGSPPEIPNPGASYKGGKFTVPGSTGNFSVTGLGFSPRVVLFFGSNKNTYDSVVSAGVSAVMRGTMAWDDLTNTIVSWCSSSVPHDSMRWEQKPIVCALNGGTGTDYQANAVSFDTDGFTVNFTTVPGGTRQVHYVAIGDMGVSFAKTIGSNFGGTTASVDVGWRIQTGLEIGGLDDTIQDANGANSEASIWGNMLTWGGKSFQSDVTGTHNSMYLCAVDTPFTGNSCYHVLENGVGSTSYIGEEGHFTGPFLTPGAVNMGLSGTGNTTVGMDVGPDNQGHFTGMPMQSNCGTVTTDDDLADFVDITSTNPDIEVPAMILFLSASGRENGAASSNPNGMSFGFWTPDHSYCVAANGNDDSFFQSEQNAWCSKVTGAGAHAGTVTSLAPATIGARLTTAVAGVTHAKLVWHMFGTVNVVPWIPQMFRRKLGG